MKRRVWLLVAFTVASTTFPTVADAGWNDFWHRVQQGFKRNRAWPEPFSYMDREVARQPFQVMIDNGWRLENTIAPPLFTEDNKLTRAAQTRVHWIITQGPPERRQVFVLRGRNQLETDQRLDAVQRFVSQVVDQGHLPAVVVTDHVPRGGSGSYLDMVNRRYVESLPAPTLMFHPSGDSN